MKSGCPLGGQLCCLISAPFAAPGIAFAMLIPLALEPDSMVKDIRLWLEPEAALPLASALYHQIIMKISWEVMPVSSGPLQDWDM